jgi:hypothetical protein
MIYSVIYYVASEAKALGRGSKRLIEKEAEGRRSG